MIRHDLRHLRKAVLACMAATLACTGQALAVEDLGWPRLHEQNGHQVTIYQPQVDSWVDHQTVHFRAAIAVRTAGSPREQFGVAEVDALTLVDTGARLVAIVGTKRELRFPNSSDAEAASLRRIVEEMLPLGQATTLSLDRVIAYVDSGDQRIQRPVEVSVVPPRVFYSTRDAILVIFLGKPRFEPIEKGRIDLQFAINTNWDLFFDPAGGRYFLLDGDGWLTAPDPIAGPWSPATALPAALSRLPTHENWTDVRAHIPGRRVATPPAVYTAIEPAELIVTEGNPKLAAIVGTELQRVTNSESVLFLHVGERRYYFLVAGRWFRAESLAGPWRAASNDLPKDFAAIPDDDPAAFVKASVPGTREAKDAVLLASVPTTTAVEIRPVAAQVAYSGAPRFVAIESTAVQYSVNTAESVFLASGRYYWCANGIWLTAAKPTGPWVYAASVPPAIYTIPPSHPAHNVTYVVVQSSTPTTVFYSQTSGYSGEYVAANGVLMFGAGLLVGVVIAGDHCDYCLYYPPPPALYSYGCGAVYHYGYGGYYASAHYYGPYGGAGRAAAYNPATGTYQRGAYAYGPAGSASVRQAYNPYTGGYAHAARVDTAYGSAGRFYAEQGGKAVAGGYRSSARGSAAAVGTSEGTGAAGVATKSGTGAAAWDTKRGQGAVVKSGSGDVYVGSDGNIYKRESGGGWSHNEGSGNWGSVERPAPAPATGPGGAARQPASQDAGAARQPPSQAGSAPAARAQAEARSRRESASGQSQESLLKDLESQARTREWGAKQSERPDQFRSSIQSSGSSRSRQRPAQRGGKQE